MIDLTKVHIFFVHNYQIHDRHNCVFLRSNSLIFDRTLYSCLIIHLEMTSYIAIVDKCSIKAMHRQI